MRRKALTATIVAVASLPGMAACSGSGDADIPVDHGLGSTDASSGTANAEPTESTLAEGCNGDTVLTVMTEDGPTEVAMVTSYADVVGTDSQSGTFTFSNTEISVDDARSVLNPTGLVDDDVVVIVSVQGAGEVTLGTYPPGEDTATEAVPEVSFFAVYDSTGRLFGTEPVLSLTYAEDGTICGELSSDSTEPGTVSGTFTATRIDSGTTRVK